MKKIIKTKSPKETEETGFLLGKRLISIKIKENSFTLALKGPLGSGKSVFTKGLSSGLGIRESIISPTFVIIKRYWIGDKFYKNFYHLDCYRLDKSEEMIILGFKKIIDDSQNIVVIEWADKIEEILPSKTVWLNFDYGEKENERIIEMDLNI